MPFRQPLVCRRRQQKSRLPTHLAKVAHPLPALVHIPDQSTTSWAGSTQVRQAARARALRPRRCRLLVQPGTDGQGFEICLHCGRTAAETAPDGPGSLAGHQPLRRWMPRAEDGRTCTGGVPNVSPFAVAGHLWLGQEICTDVCEVQLYGCESRQVALTIALALREIAARRLGVDSDEMGFAAPEASRSGLARNYSAVVLDRASGGAGFVDTIARPSGSARGSPPTPRLHGAGPLWRP